jgi:hypothetical protein
MKKYVAIALFISITVGSAVFFIANIPSHPECGTAGIDYMPCEYWSRVNWSIQNGFWIPVLIIGLFAFTISLLIVKHRSSDK